MNVDLFFITNNNIFISCLTYKVAISVTDPYIKAFITTLRKKRKSGRNRKTVNWKNFRGTLKAKKYNNFKRKT